MAYNMLVRHQVADYDQWKPVFDQHAENRKQHGSNGGVLLRNAENPNEILIILEFDSVEHAREFTQDPSLRQAMSQGGVSDRPDVYFLNEVERLSA